MQLVLHYGISHANWDELRIKSHAESAEWKEWLARQLYYCTQTFTDLKGLLQLVLHYGMCHANWDELRIKSHAESAE